MHKLIAQNYMFYIVHALFGGFKNLGIKLNFCLNT